MARIVDKHLRPPPGVVGKREIGFCEREVQTNEIDDAEFKRLTWKLGLRKESYLMWFEQIGE
ncbi:hypothetical protein [uncultured Gimesia sp.]|jgi:hypothetical protein|uniref:hypothetical protein n=1 Tax=uncultured Gimesia sp. TaxID=1678688 RepID=UPI00262D827A|nr:hypothetical protein [uncultured Gimesia sp.]